MLVGIKCGRFRQSHACALIRLNKVNRAGLYSNPIQRKIKHRSESGWTGRDRWIAIFQAISSGCWNGSRGARPGLSCDSPCWIVVDTSTPDETLIWFQLANSAIRLELKLNGITKQSWTSQWFTILGSLLIPWFFVSLDYLASLVNGE